VLDLVADAGCSTQMSVDDATEHEVIYEKCANGSIYSVTIEQLKKSLLKVSKAKEIALYVIVCLINNGQFSSSNISYIKKYFAKIKHFLLCHLLCYRQIQNESDYTIFCAFVKYLP